MNPERTKVNPRMAPRMPEANAPKAKDAPPKAAPARAAPAKIEVDPALLSYTLARDLGRIPPEEWSKIESVPCRVGFTRDMAEGVRFVDAVANVVNQHGGLFATQDLSKRRDLEQSSRQIVDAFRAFIRTTVQVARKLRLTNILERHWRLLSAYGSPPKKADETKTDPKPDAAKRDSDPAEAA